MALRGESHPAHKLTENQVKSIRNLWKVGHRNVRVLAQNNGVSPANIRRIVRNETWVHLLVENLININNEGRRKELL